MKHNLLRRLCALVLAVVMTASLCAIPAWAAQGTGPELSAHVIAMPNTTDRFPLTITGLSGGNTVTLTVTSGSAKVTVEDDAYNPVINGSTTTITVPQDENSVTVYVSAENSSSGKIEVKAFDGAEQYGQTRTCHVYRGIAPIRGMPASPLASLAEGSTRDLSIEFESGLEDVTISEEIRKISFRSSSTSVATVSSVTTSGTNGFKTTITGVSKGRITISMILYGGYTQEWDLTVTENVSVPVTFVGIPKPLTMTAGETYTFAKSAITILPTNATNQTLLWESSNKAVADVDENGKVTAIAAGTAVITARAADGVNDVSDTCTVTVKESAAALTLTPTTLVLNMATSETRGTITANLTGENSSSSGTTVTWSSSNTSVATVSPTTGRSVTVTAVKAGTATITATATFKDSSGKTITTKTATCAVTVLDANSTPITSMTLSESTHSMPTDGTFTISVASVTPANAPVKTVTWDSSDKSVATVDPKTGVVTAKGPGQTAIIATADFGGAQAICVLTVTQKAETISLSFAYDSNTAGTNKYRYTFSGSGNNYINVTAALGPKGTYPPADPIRWTSKSTAVATVSSSTSASTRATVTAVGPGKTTITAAPLDPFGNVRESVDPAEIELIVSGIIVKKDDSAVTSLTIVQDHRETLTAEAFGTANNGNSSCDWTCSDPSIVSIAPKTGESTVLTARQAGTVTITARKGTYVATCTVTVAEDSVGVIETSTQPGVPCEFSSLASRLQTACTTKTGSSLAYITNLSVSSTDQGILYDQHHSSADTGAGVGMQDKYYPGTAPQGQRSLSDLSFVPKNTFSGTAEISYTAWSTDNKSFSGLIRISVNGTGDVMYASSEGSVVTFQADDFNLYHPNLRSVSFTLPLDSRGVLYYDYTSASQPGTKVTAGTAYYRTGTPSLNRVSFVPTAGYEGTVTITYTATDTSGRNTTGKVTINVTNNKGGSSSPADLYYPVAEDSWVTFQPADFNTASMAVLGEALSYVRFSLPASSDGTLFYNYRGFGNYDSAVASTTSYYYGGTPSLGSVSFVPTTTTPGQVEIKYTGYSVRGNTFTGTIHIGESDPNNQGGLRYTVFTGKSVYFNATDFNNACISATGASLSYVMFSPLPAVGEGTLRYTRGSSSTLYNLATTTRCYRTSSSTSDILLGSVSFLANNSFTGTVTIPFTGYNTNNVSFTGEVVITVTPPTSGDSVYYGTTASPLALSSSRMRSACSDALDGTLSYITFTSLPSASAGRLYLNYNGFGTGTQVNTGTQYYVSSTPSIDQISFVPRGRYTGQVSVGYTATATNGKSVSGILTFNITSTGNSAYFNDMAYHTWAGPAVDYLYRNGVTNGVTANTYGPEEHILRCDFVLMLCRAFHFTGGSGYSFADVPTDAYFADAVATAKQLGIVNGDGVNFMPYSELTRQDAMVIFKNALDAAGWNVTNASTSVLSTFPDGTSVASYARTAVSTLVQLGAVSGDNGMLYPYNPITRAEAAVILHFVMTM